MDEIRLLNKPKSGIIHKVFSKTGILLMLLMASVACFFLLMTFFADIIYRVMGGVTIFNLLVIIYLINTDMDSTAKLTWILVVSATSIFGTLFYLYTRADVGKRAVKEVYSELCKKHRSDLPQNPQTMEAVKEESPDTASLVTYLNRHEAFPISRYNQVTYYPLGENKWEAMLEDLRKAEKFIFMEYFIIDEGKMWGSILSILKEKAAQGVDVRVMYDGTCAMSTLPYDYPEMMQKLGIQCKMFSPLRPFVSTHYNYRDHRKILVIDGKVGYNGGVNLADEYINAIERFGHWKDTALRIEGEAVKSLTLMFLNMWCFGEQEENLKPFLNVSTARFPLESGYVMPFGFNPFHRDRKGEKVYMDILNRACSYVHIMTPYLIVDDELLQSLKFAAERGVDVRLILPGIPDKKLVYALAKTYFSTLLASGVKIYLYTPGFVHAKVFVSDDCKAVVGTINLDYRSLYHHFECGTYLYNVPCIEDIEKDFLETQDKCQLVTEQTIRDEKLSTKFIGSTMRLVAPLL